MNEILELRHHAEDMLGVPSRLHDYQWEGVSFLFRSSAALLADEMGLGKTVQASVALALLLNAKNDIRRSLIVAPASLITNWMAELDIWAPSLAVRRLQGTISDREALYMLPVPVLVGSYEQIRKDGLDRIPANTFDIVILDEAQRIKNKYSRTSLACRLLPRKHSWALSATPLENDAEDVASILGFLNPSLPTDLSSTQLSSMLSSMMLRRRKREVRGELPPVIIQDMKLELLSSQKVAYDQLWMERKNAVGTDAESPAAVLLGLITRLKIVCNFDSETNKSSKLDALKELCEGMGANARVLVFSQFVETLKWLSQQISIPCDFITGSMSIDERQNAIESFKTGRSPRILFISLRAGGVGLNLGEATHVVMFDRWWNPAVEMQAIYRAHRFDREDPLHVVRFLVVDTIEERIASILGSKEEMFSDIVESVETASRGFSVKELMYILELSESGMNSTTERQEEN
ncbi:MAG: DEAD/DEAH box helicase [Gammaproteobacteria bacterium]|nr:DEAD/DEAH box helicase [Gammaproteobacteria bacterium]MYH46132.1 DEAD/DEAH box helicase [Gammaproteobacteria bacterium]MYL14698.1 DEAD/DEAH box helicase [Gammaproteobacteria bacterium]